MFVFDPPDRFIAGTVGQPGSRTFFLQARRAGQVVSVILEKVQVAVLAERLGVLLDELEARGITLLPDFVANAAAAFLFCGLLEQRFAPTIESIFSETSRQLRTTTRALLKRSRTERVSSRRAAEQIAEERLRARLTQAGTRRDGA